MTHRHQPAEKAKPSDLLPFTPRRFVELLWPKAAEKLSRADLLAIIDGGSSFATEAAGNAGEVVAGLGCLVLHDADNGPGAGNFQDGQSVAPLLFHLQAQLESLAAVSAAVGFAASELSVRETPMSVSRCMQGQGKGMDAQSLATALGVTVPPEVQQFWQRAERVAKSAAKRKTKHPK